MRIAVFCVAIAFIASTFDIHAEQQRAPRRKPPAPRTATFAILVTDPAGEQIPNVLVTVEGPTARSTRTEGGRIAFENLTPGEYLVRFEKDGFIPHERQLTARAGAPIEIKVTLKPLPPPPPPPEPERPEPAPSTAKPAAFDVPSVIEREFIGRAAQKVTALACSEGSTATLIQLNGVLADHVHDEADEFLYVVAGEGAADVDGTAHKLYAGVLLFVPHGVTHRLSQSGRNPLMVLSTRSGSGCAGGQSP
jgi:mannose-6-phosphate isomerase-like protein (cupin superfamily)